MKTRRTALFAPRLDQKPTAKFIFLGPKVWEHLRILAHLGRDRLRPTAKPPLARNDKEVPAGSIRRVAGRVVY